MEQSRGGQERNMDVSQQQIEAAREILKGIEVIRTYPGPGKRSTTPTKARTISLSKPISDALDQLQGAASHHIEKALALYLKLV